MVHNLLVFFALYVVLAHIILQSSMGNVGYEVRYFRYEIRQATAIKSDLLVTSCWSKPCLLKHWGQGWSGLIVRNCVTFQSEMCIGASTM
jgi:hypothetical protein